MSSKQVQLLLRRIMDTNGRTQRHICIRAFSFVQKEGKKGTVYFSCKLTLGSKNFPQHLKIYFYSYITGNILRLDTETNWLME
jgi:hypothetical protein